jgi:hypothetical protein
MPVAVLSISATFPIILVLGVPTFTLGALTVICTFSARDIDDIDPIAAHSPVTDAGVVDRLACVGQNVIVPFD